MSQSCSILRSPIEFLGAHVYHGQTSVQASVQESEESRHVPEADHCFSSEDFQLALLGHSIIPIQLLSPWRNVWGKNISQPRLIDAKIIEIELPLKFSFREFSTFQILGYGIAANRLEIKMAFFFN